METDGEKFVRLASAKLFKADGRTPQEYVFGAVVPMNDPDWMGPWDCAEYCSWSVYQGMRLIYGCTEIELLVGPEDSPVPTFPTTRLHVEAEVERALAGETTRRPDLP